MMNAENVDNVGGHQQQDQDNSKPSYTIPGILHYIQHEWSRFEMDRSQWDVERAELQAKIAFLEGERKGQENLKRDLIRRIKMLEYALRQERARFHKHKYGTDLVLELRSKDNSNDEMKQTINNDLQQQQQQQGGNNNNMNSTTTLRHGRQLLRQYLQEVGYTETILDVRSQRVRALLSNNNHNNDMQTAADNIQLMNGMMKKSSITTTTATSEKIQSPPAKKNGEIAPSSDDSGGAFITETSNGKSSDELDDDDEEDDDDDIIDDVTSAFDDIINASNDADADENEQQQDEEDMTSSVDGDLTTGDVVDSSSDDVTSSANEDTVLQEFDFLDGDDGGVKDWPVDRNKIDEMKEQFQKEKRTNKKKGSKRPIKKDLQNMLETLKGSSDGASSGGSGSDDTSSASVSSQQPTSEEDSLPFTVGGPRINDESIENALGLGDLAGLTVANEADILCLNVNSSSKEAYRKMWNPKFTLRSHFDAVRSIRFLPNTNGCITASEDHTLKLWNLNKPVTNKRTSSLDLDPIYTFRGHVGGVLCCEIGGTSETGADVCYSGGMDATIRSWVIPSISLDPYEKYDPTISGNVLIGHTDAVWSLSYSGSPRDQLLSASSDMTVRLWNPRSNDPLLQTYHLNDSSAPTCVEFVRCDCNHAVASFADGKIVVHDLETGKTPVVLQDSGDAEDRVNCVVSHPTMPITISAHDDRQIKFFDNNSGKKIHQMVAHLDVVSCLAVDPNGLYLLSGSHDSSIRLWNLDTKTCVQEMTSHRKKFDESVHSVASNFESSQLIASAGADAIVKIFQ